MVTFNYIPPNLRVPGNYTEFTPTGGVSSGNQYALIVGQMLSTGTATINTPILIGSLPDAVTAFGANSMLHVMAQRWFKNNSSISVAFLPLVDDAGATPTIKTATVTGPATSAGTVYLYVAGIRTATAVANGDTATIIATNIANTINTTSVMPASASASAGVVTITALNAGYAAGDIDVRVNYRQKIGGESLPTGVGVTIATQQQGTTDPITDAALANAVTQDYAYVVYPYPLATQMVSIETYLSDATGTWSWESAKYGHAFAAYRGTYAQLATYGVTNNNQHTTVFGVYDTPDSMYNVATAVVAAASTSLAASPATPLIDLDVDVLAPPSYSQFTIVENNTLLFDGISTLQFDRAGDAFIQDAITTYQTNASGDVDTSYLYVETLYQLAFVAQSITDDLTNKFSRYILFATGANIPPDLRATTPALVCAEAINEYLALEAQGIVQDGASFAQKASGTMGTQSGTVELYLPVTLAGQLRTIKTQIAFNTP